MGIVPLILRDTLDTSRLHTFVEQLVERPEEPVRMDDLVLSHSGGFCLGAVVDIPHRLGLDVGVGLFVERYLVSRHYPMRLDQYRVRKRPQEEEEESVSCMSSYGMVYEWRWDTACYPMHVPYQLHGGCTGEWGVRLARL